MKQKRIKQKLFEIKVYKMNVDKKFYRAESQGISCPSRTIRGAIVQLYKDLEGMGWLE